MTHPQADRPDLPANPWPALYALCIGFFMILVDSTIVSVATETMVRKLDTSLNNVLWVTSAYLLTYAVPLLITGRLGDRFGPKRVYLLGLAIFTAASAWCGLTDSVQVLIAARAVQGLGAALLAPQTMAVITRTFPGERRGRAMGLWGAVAGVATLVGPILGGVLVDHAGWQWIFFINLPFGVIGLILAWRLVPNLPIHSHRFDIPGVVLSAVAMTALVFGIQQGEQYHWGTITGIISVPLLIGIGIVVFAIFIYWQWRNQAEPLVPLRLFANRNFTLANVAITTVGFAITAMAFPILIYAQAVLGYSPTEAALLLVPMAVISGGLAPITGRMVDRYHPAILAGFGLICFAAALVWYAVRLGAHTSLAELLCAAALLGVANGFMWSPLSVTATRTLQPQFAGAGAGIYNTTRQLGAVLGSAAIAALMDSRIAAHLGSGATSASAQSSGPMPAMIKQPFARAMGESLYLPAAVLVIGIIAALCFANPHAPRGRHAAR